MGKKFGVCPRVSPGLPATPAPAAQRGGLRPVRAVRGGLPGPRRPPRRLAVRGGRPGGGGHRRAVPRRRHADRRGADAAACPGPAGGGVVHTRSKVHPAPCCNTPGLSLNFSVFLNNRVVDTPQSGGNMRCAYFALILLFLVQKVFTYFPLI